MWSLRPVPPLLVLMGLSVCSPGVLAQRGAAAAHSAPATGRSTGRIGSAPSVRATAPAIHTRSTAATSPWGNYSNPGSLFLPPAITSTRPVFYSNGTARYGREPRHDRRGGYSGAGFVTLGYPGYPGFDYDPDFLDPTYNPNNTPDAPAYPVPEALSAPQPAAPGPDAYREPEQEPPVYVAAPPRRPAPEPPPLPEEDAVTIIFKDGRKPEQVRNYALTRTALYITAGRVRTIPIDQIDVPATEAANAKSGVDFHLPSTQ